MPTKKNAKDEPATTAARAGARAQEDAVEATVRAAEVTDAVTRQAGATARQAAALTRENTQRVTEQVGEGVARAAEIGRETAQNVTQQVSGSVRQGAQVGLDTAQSMNQQLIAGLQQANQLTLDAVNAWVDAISRVVPNVPVVPFADEWRDAALASFEFAGQLIDVQRQFAERFYAALAPLTGDSN